MKNFIKEFVENEKYIENIFDINELKNFNLDKYYDFYILEKHFEELKVHGFGNSLEEIPVDTQSIIQKKVRKRIEELVNLRLCLLDKISFSQNLEKFDQYLPKNKDIILNPFCNDLNTSEKITKEINKQILFLI